MSGENKKVDANSDAGGGPLDTLLLRSLLPADSAEQSQEAQDLARVRARLVELANQPHISKPQPRRKRVGTKRVQPVGRTGWIWVAGAAALLAGAVTGWILISPNGNGASGVVQTPPKKTIPEVVPTPKTEDVAKKEPSPIVVEAPKPQPVAPEVKNPVVETRPKNEADSHAIADTQKPIDTAPVVDIAHGLATNASVNGKLCLGFNYNCAATGCQIENSVYAKDGVAYVETKYAKNASVFGMKDGAIQHFIYNLAARTITMFDPGSKTYFVMKRNELAKDPIYVLLGMLDKSSHPDELLSYKQKSGVITTSVTKAEKNSDFRDDLLRVPSGYTEVPAPKQ
jgi:hypothetical protein